MKLLFDKKQILSKLITLNSHELHNQIGHKQQHNEHSSITTMRNDDSKLLYTTKNRNSRYADDTSSRSGTSSTVSGATFASKSTETGFPRMYNYKPPPKFIPKLPISI